MDEKTLDERIHHGQEVARFLTNPTIVQLLIDMDNLYKKQWKLATDPTERERLWSQARALDDLQAYLLGIADSGTLAQAEVDQRGKRQD